VLKSYQPTASHAKAKDGAESNHSLRSKFVFPRVKLIQFASGLFTSGRGPWYEMFKIRPRVWSQQHDKPDSNCIWCGLSDLKDSSACFHLEFASTKVSITLSWPSLASMCVIIYNILSFVQG
jgi:hypothetical protein